MHYKKNGKSKNLPFGLSSTNHQIWRQYQFISIYPTSSALLHLTRAKLNVCSHPTGWLSYREKVECRTILGDIPGNKLPSYWPHIAPAYRFLDIIIHVCIAYIKPLAGGPLPYPMQCGNKPRPPWWPCDNPAARQICFPRFCPQTKERREAQEKRRARGSLLRTYVMDVNLFSYFIDQTTPRNAMNVCSITLSWTR